MNPDTLTLPPYVGTIDRKALARLRLARWHARLWMRSQGIRDLGRTTGTIREAKC